MIGETFGKWTVTGDDTYKTFPSGQRQRYWMCTCECGNEKSVFEGSLIKGVSYSCGCHAAEINTTHSMHGTPTYSSWHAMKQRCLNEKSSKYDSYGGSGITVCDKWLNFEGFFDDMGERPDNHTLDRIDNELGYCKDNCCWSNTSLQNHNRRPKAESGYKGVYPSRDGWYTRINFGGVFETLGHFSCKEDAAKCYNKRALEIYGEKASLNPV